MLDLLLFGTLKRSKKCLPRDEKEDRGVDRILSNVDLWKEGKIVSGRELREPPEAVMEPNDTIQAVWYQIAIILD
jgi:hypothetical protein